MVTIDKYSRFYKKYTKLNFIDKPFHLICGICNEIFKHPHQTKCGCRFCLSCLENHLESESRLCPTKSKECEFISLDNISFDVAINKEVMKLIIYCPHGSCKVNKSLKEIIDHVNECEYRMVKCSMCNDDYQFKNLRKHEDKECQNRQLDCKNCSKKMLYQYYTTEHLNPDCDDLCDKYSVDECPNKCSTKGFIDNLREHLKICSKAKQKCPLSTSKCSNSKFSDEELKVHFDKNLLNHNQYLKNQIEKLKSEIEKLKIEMEKIKEYNESELQTNLLRLEKTVLELKDKKVDENTAVSTRIHQNGSYIWRIDSFHEKRRNAELGGPVSITSDPFYTSEFGYKMCLKLYPAGDGAGRGTHLSIYFVIMKGDFDNVLSWPFKKKVILELLDQEGNEKHYTEVFKPDEKSMCFDKPKEAMNVASGAPKFYEWNNLLKSKFYKDDTIYVKISII